jgi:hypothetical protein
MVFGQVVGYGEWVGKEKLARLTALTAVFVTSKAQSFVNAKLIVILKVGLDKLEELAAVGTNGMCVRL